LRYVAIEKENQRLMIALERPGATADGGDYVNSIELKNVKPEFKLPNITAHYRKVWKWGHVQLAGIAKSIKWKDLDSSGYNLSGSAVGYGVNLSTVIDVSDRLKLKMQGEYGKGIENYIADVTPDVGLKSQPGNLAQPFQGTALPVWGFLAFAEINWTQTIVSSVGYSMLKIDNSDLQSAAAFKRGQYGLINLRYQPLINLIMAAEYQYGRRDNFSDGFHSNGNKIQLSFEYLFSTKFEKSE
jgi:hypothetical protein